MFTVTPIGSCRIAGPLRHGQAHHGIGLNLARCYGYCHSPAEAAQLARFLQGDADIPEDIWPLVSPSRPRGDVVRETHDPSHLYVVELASAKELSIDGVSVQLNYLTSAFRAFFSEPARAQTFWAHAESGDEAAMRTFLARDWAADDMQRAEAELLGRLRLSHVTRESLRGAIETLADMLPEVLFVTHVDARKPDGAPIASRQAFIRMVKDEVAEAGLACFDPTTLMETFGQTDAIDDHSTSLAHFTEPFTKAVMEEWLRSVIAPITDAGLVPTPTATHLAALERQIAAAQERGAHGDACVRLDRLARHVADVAALRDDAARRWADARAAFRDEIGKIDPSACPNEKIDALLDRASGLGLFDIALELAEAADTVSIPVLMRAARRAAEAEMTEAAFDLVCAVLARALDVAPANALAARLAAEAPIRRLGQLPEADLRRILAFVPPAELPDVLDLQGLPATTAARVLATEDDLADMVGDLFRRERLDDAAALMAAWRHASGTARLRQADLVAMLDAWVATALDLPAPLDRLANLAKVRIAAPAHSGLKRALRAHKQDLAERMRAAGAADDEDALKALEHEVALFPAPLPEYSLWRARLRFGRKDDAGAIRFGLKAAEHLPGTLSVWVLLMRAAVRSGLHDEAARFARTVHALTCDGAERLRAEAEGVLDAGRVAS